MADSKKQTITKKQIDVAKALAEKLEMRWYAGRTSDGSVVLTEAELNNVVFLLKHMSDFADVANNWTPKRIILDKNPDMAAQTLSIWMEDSLGNTKTCSYAVSDLQAIDFCVDQDTFLEMISRHFADSIFKPLLKETLKDFSKSIIQNASVSRSS